MSEKSNFKSRRKPVKLVTVTEGHRTGEFDEKVAPLAQQLWRLGECAFEQLWRESWHTLILFRDVNNVRRFLNVVGDHNVVGPTGLWVRMCHEDNVMKRTRPRNGYGWRYGVYVRDEELPTLIDGKSTHKGPDFTVKICVAFPTRDLSEVLERLTTYNVKRGHVPS